ncbi:unnamed protein product [Closterium sp. NIES-54]
MRLLGTLVTDPSFESTAASALVAELVDFAAHCLLDYAASLVAESESESVCPPSVGGECALGMDVLEDRQGEFECFAAAVPHLVSMLLAPEGDPDAPDIPTPRSYAKAIEGPYSSQWQVAMDAEMASWKSTGTYVDEVPTPGANIVSGMKIFRVKRRPGSPPVFKARSVARGFIQRQGVDFFQTFYPTPKMTTLRGSLHEEIWLRRPPGFTGSFPAGTQWSLRRPVYGLRQAPREWHDTLRTTLAALDFAPSTADPPSRAPLSQPSRAALAAPSPTLRPSRRPSWTRPAALRPRRPPRGLRAALTCGPAALTCGPLRPYLRPCRPHLRTPPPFPATSPPLPAAPSPLPAAPPPLPAALPPLPAAPPPLPAAPPPLPVASPRLPAVPAALKCGLAAPSLRPRRPYLRPRRPYLRPRRTYLRPPAALNCGLAAPTCGPAAPHLWVLRYLCSTSGMELVLGGRSPVVLTGHADASWADDQATQRSSPGYTFSLGSGSVWWQATRSSSVLGSSCEAEIYAGAMAAQELCWLTYLLTDLGEPPRSPPVLYVDNKAMLALCREQRLEHRTKHIALRYFLARELQQRGQLRLAYVASEANTADVFTKALAPCDHQRFCTQLGLVPVLPHLLTS